MCSGPSNERNVPDVEVNLFSPWFLRTVPLHFIPLHTNVFLASPPSRLSACLWCCLSCVELKREMMDRASSETIDFFLSSRPPRTFLFPVFTTLAAGVVCTLPTTMAHKNTHLHAARICIWIALLKGCCVLLLLLLLLLRGDL